MALKYCLLGEGQWEVDTVIDDCVRGILNLEEVNWLFLSTLSLTRSIESSVLGPFSVHHLTSWHQLIEPVILQIRTDFGYIHISIPAPSIFTSVSDSQRDSASARMLPCIQFDVELIEGGPA